MDIPKICTWVLTVNPLPSGLGSNKHNSSMTEACIQCSVLVIARGKLLALRLQISYKLHVLYTMPGSQKQKEKDVSQDCLCATLGILEGCLAGT